MSDLKKISKRLVSDVIERAGLDATSVAMLKPQQAIDEAVKVLAGARRFSDALKIVAHALPKRESVWWACTCCRAVTDESSHLDEIAAIQAAEIWVREPSDKNARAAYTLAEKLGFKTPGGWAAVSAFWSSSSLSPPDQPVVPPAPYLTGVAVAGAVTLAAVIEPVAKMTDRQERFLSYGLEIAAGGDARKPDGSPR